MASFYLQTLTNILNKSIMVSKVLSIDASLVSKWTSGKRKLLSDTEICDKLSAYLLSKCRGDADVEWLSKQHAKIGIDAASASEEDFKQCLTVGLAHDGGQRLQGYVTEDKAGMPDTADYKLRTSFAEIGACIDGLLSQLQSVEYIYERVE